MSNSSIITADRATHLKIVVVALLASLAVLIAGISARPQADIGGGMQIVKAGSTMLATSGAATSIR
jgi:hypothetical protein